MSRSPAKQFQCIGCQYGRLKISRCNANTPVTNPVTYPGKDQSSIHLSPNLEKCEVLEKIVEGWKVEGCFRKRSTKQGKARVVGGGKLRPSTQGVAWPGSRGQDGWSGGVAQVLPELPPDRPHVKAENSNMKSFQSYRKQRNQI